MKRKNKIVYSPTVYGLYSSVAKRFNFPSWLTPNAGGETWHVEGSKDNLIDLKGTPSLISKGSLNKERKNYFNPILGAGQRWKESMNNDTNPLKGLFRTVVPAVAGAAAINYAPQVVTKVIPQVAKTIVRHPKLATQIGKKLAINVGTDLATGWAGGTAVDLSTNIITGKKSWGEFAAPYLGISKDLADWTNPGYALGPGIIGRNLKNNFNLFSKSKKDLIKNAEDIDNTQNLIKNNQDNIKQLTSSIESGYDEAHQINDKRIELQRKVNNAEAKISQYSLKSKPVRQSINRSKKLRRDILNSDQFPIDVTEFALNIPGTKLKKLPTNSFLQFIDQNGKSFKSSLSIYPKPISDATVLPIHMPLKYEQGELKMMRPEYTVTYNGSQRFGNIFSSNTPEVQKGISDYVDGLNTLMGDDGTVAGSLIHYKNGIFPATESNGKFIGPADTEIYTTQQRLPSLQSKLQFKETKLNSTGGHKGTSPHTFRGDASHSGIDTEINIIEQDSNGNASGKVAHQIYRALYPEKYSQLMYDHAMSPKTTGSFSTTSLPISAEELFQTVNKNPQAMQKHLLTDMIGMETFTNSNHTKASKRLFSALFNDYGDTPKLLGESLEAHGKYNLGSQFKQATDLYPQLNLNDTNANAEFLKAVYKLSDEEAARFSANPQVMKNAVNLYNFQRSVGTRVAGRDIVTDMADNGQQWHDPKIELFTGNGSFGGGNYSGDGLNRALLNPWGGWHFGKSRSDQPMDLVSVTQAPLTLFPEKIKTPMDLFNQVSKIEKTPRQSDMGAPNLVKAFDRSKKLDYDTQAMQNIVDLAKQRDMPINFNMGLYDFGYSGSYVPPIAAGARRSAEGDTHELGSLLKDIQQYNSSGTISTLEIPEVQENVNQANQSLQTIFDNWQKANMKERSEIRTDHINNLYYDIDLPYAKYTRDQYKLYNNDIKFSEYLPKYLEAKKEYNDLIQQRSPLNHQLALLRRQDKRLQTQRFQQKNELKSNESQLNKLNWTNSDLNRNIKNSKSNIKDNIVLPGIGLGAWYGLNLGFNNSRNMELKYANEALDEQYGKSNPIRGFYKDQQFHNYLDEGYTTKQAQDMANQDELKLIKKYYNK